MATKRKLRRRGEQAPRPMTDAELASAGLAAVEDRLVEHRGRFARLRDEGDPGKGRPRAEAEEARAARMKALEQEVREIERLEPAAEALSREAQAEANFRRDPLFHKKRDREVGARLDPGTKATIREANEELRRRESERKAEEQIRDLADRHRHPADPRAESLLAAVLADDSLFEALEVKLREDGRGGYTSTHDITPLEIGVLVTTLGLLRERGSVEIGDFGASAKWPRRDPPLVTVDGLRGALLELRRMGYLAFKVEAGTARVTYGPAVREIAAKWGLELSQVAEAATPSA